MGAEANACFPRSNLASHGAGRGHAAITRIYDIQRIPYARVPIIKFAADVRVPEIDEVVSIRVDLSFTNVLVRPGGRRNRPRRGEQGPWIDPAQRACARPHRGRHRLATTRG